MNRATKQTFSGLSKRATTRSYRGAKRRVTNLGPGKQHERRKMQEQRRREQIEGLSQVQQDMIREMDVDDGMEGYDIDSGDFGRFVPSCPAPGDEANSMSHEGGEFEVFTELANDIARMQGRKRTDNRPRTDRTEQENANWQPQMELLVAAYLEVRSRDRGDGMPSPPPSPSLAPEGESFTIDALDSFGRQSLVIHAFKEDRYPNESLLHYGYLGGSPLHPQTAFSLRSLEMYRQTHRTCPQFSIEAQCKTLCHMHNLPYHEYLQRSFSHAYDAYLEMHRQIDILLNTELGYDTAVERIRRTCPPCFYALKNEPELEFSCLVSMDGNNSLKRLDASIRERRELQDSRCLSADRWVPPSKVDVFKHESREQHTDDDSSPDVPPQDINPGSVPCKDRWKNASPEDKKKMFALFDEAGIFIASCRHRMVLAVCDMIKTGEQTKYPLAILNYLIDIIGPHLGCAYDVGCSFDTTLNNSSLATKASEAKVRMMVGSFHGHAHNRACQLDWHPLHIAGTGLTEGEGCEQVFSASNGLARGTRHASTFHRHQAIEEHFQFWDQDKYANLSTFIVNHYAEAVKIVESHAPELEKIKEELKLEDHDFKTYLSQEKQYLASLKPDSPQGNVKIQYVKALRELSDCRHAWSEARTAANQVFTSTNLANLHQTINATRHRVDVSYSKLQNAEELVGSLENLLGITERWTSTSPEYIEYHQQTVATNYSEALDKLERLVVMRLFELAKISRSGTGYKLRQQIGKALQRRSAAVRTALNQYNTEAARLNPPRPPLSWKEIVDYSFLAEFDLLRHSNTGLDIRNEAWAQPTQREATAKHFKLLRAREELERLNVEIRRLCTFIRDDEIHYSGTILRLMDTKPHLGAELKRRWQLRSAINRVHILRLSNLEISRGLKDVCIPGISIHAHPSRNGEEAGATDANIQDRTHSEEFGLDNDDEDNDGIKMLELMTDFVLSIDD